MKLVNWILVFVQLILNGEMQKINYQRIRLSNDYHKKTKNSKVGPYLDQGKIFDHFSVKSDHRANTVLEHEAWNGQVHGFFKYFSLWIITVVKYIEQPWVACAKSKSENGFPPKFYSKKYITANEGDHFKVLILLSLPTWIHY